MADLAAPIHSQVFELNSFAFAICLPEYSDYNVVLSHFCSAYCVGFSIYSRPILNRFSLLYICVSRYKMVAL